MAKDPKKPSPPAPRVKPARPAANAATRSATPFAPKVTIRMYRQGLGDCFLLRFETEPEEFFDVAIDCGIYRSSPDAARIMNDVVDDIVQTTKDEAHPHGHLDILVVTHEHWDHISGFSQALAKFEAMSIGAVWQGWTEKPGDPLADELRRRYRKVKAALVSAMRAARMRLGGVPSGSLEQAFQVMGFFGIDGSEGDDDAGADKAFGAIRRMLAGKKPSYLSPGEVRSVGETDVRAFVLGPPKDIAAIAKDDPGKKDGYAKQQTAFFDGFEAMLGAAGAMGGAEDADSSRNPFDRRCEIPLETARRMEFFHDHYGSDDRHPEAFRSIDDLPNGAYGSLALRLDSHINNLSLVLAFRLPGGGVLLFPGDAQGGNWKSWAALAAPLAFPEYATDAHELLAATVFYKVAHHGSHNATPRTYGLDLMTSPGLRAFVPVDGAIAGGAGYGEMPLVAIVHEVTRKTGGSVVQSDSAGGVPKHFRMSEKLLRVRVEKGGELLERPLWCETEYPLN